MGATIVWFRRDFRLSDHPALTAAVALGQPIVPVFIHDTIVDALGAAPKWRMARAVEHFGGVLAGIGSQLILRRGEALAQLQDLVSSTGATHIYWSRAYDPETQTRDTAVKTAMKDQGIEANSFQGHLLFEPWTVETKTGGFYRVYSPMWKAVRDRPIADPLPAPKALLAPEIWPASDTLPDWNMDVAMNRGGAVLAQYANVGEAAAQERLAFFEDSLIDRYKMDRDIPGKDATSRMSENLAVGEISPRQCWTAGQRAMARGKQGAEHFLKEVVWREFAYHLLHHTPHILTNSWREGWDNFGWISGDQSEHLLAWKQGRTGIPFVDAAMRELYVTGTMHNRARMIVASYLTKHMLTHWQVGKAWFENCLIDWDPASNAMGWQWVAGCGPDAAPYFRIFNPETQAEKFDPNNLYLDRWLAEGRVNPTETAMSYYQAIPRSWGLKPDLVYPKPVVDLREGRQKALAAYENREF